MKNYNSFLVEYVGNEKLVHYFILNTISKIKNINNNIDIEFNFNADIRDDYFSFEIFNNNSQLKKTESELLKLSKKLSRSGTYLNWVKRLNPHIIDFKVYFKDVKLNRKTVPKILYHVSNKKNRNSILTNGLKIMPNINFDFLADLGRPDAIFTSSDLSFWSAHVSDSDIWKIDTNKIKNKWFKDFNIPHTNISFITYENIPKEAITLISNKK